MSEFKCVQCNYKTNNKSNYNKHLNSIKHTKNSINISLISSTPLDQFIKNFQCQYCQSTFTRQYSLTKHKKICMEKKLEIQKLENEKQIEIEKLKTELEFNKKLMREKDIKIHSLEKFIEVVLHKNI